MDNHVRIWFECTEFEIVSQPYSYEGEVQRLIDLFIQQMLLSNATYRTVQININQYKCPLGIEPMILVLFALCSTW